MAVTRVNFKKGLDSVFQLMLQTHDGIDPGTFYITLDEDGNPVNFYLGELKLDNVEDIEKAIADLKDSDIAQLRADIGNLVDLETVTEDNLVSAINEVLDTAIAKTITIDKDSENPDWACVYTISQGGQAVGSIQIPKDMVVKSGSVVVNPTPELQGTYIALVLANATNDTIYIDVKYLVDIYTVQANATEVQLAMSPTREISATIVAKSIAFDKLTDAAVAEIRDAITLEPGSENGTLSFRGVDVKVTGLKSAAYEDVSYFDAAGSASAALDSAKQYADQQIDQKLTDSLTWKDFE